MKFDYINIPTGYHADFGNLFYVPTSTPAFNTMKAPHYHNSYELYFVVSGRKRYIFEDSSIELCKGDALLISPYVLHRTMDINPNDSSTTKRILLNFTTNWLLKYFTENSLRHLFNQLGEISHFRLSEENTKKAIAIADRIGTEAQKNNNEMSKFYVYKLLTFFTENSICDIYDKEEHYAQSIISAASEYINTHPQQKITIDILAKNLYISKQSLNKIFKNTLMTTPHDFIEHIRLKNARFLLMASDYTIVHISELCGYSLPTNFSQRFKKKYGLLPSEFRKIVRLQGGTFDEFIHR